MVERGLHETAQLQARTAAATSIAQIESRLSELTAAVRDSLVKVGEISERNRQIARSLAWKTIGMTAVWLTAAAIGVRILLV